jgi:hypothetical protein
MRPVRVTRGPDFEKPVESGPVEHGDSPRSAAVRDELAAVDAGAEPGRGEAGVRGGLGQAKPRGGGVSRHKVTVTY